MVGVKGQVQRRGVERRKAIVRAALELFTRRGARGTSIADVAECVGISAPAVLHHFHTKDELLLAVLAERDRRAAGPFHDLVGQGGLAGLAALVEAAAQNEQERGLVGCYVVLEAENLQPGDPAHDFFVERSGVMRAALRAAITAGVRSGEIRGDVDVETKAAEIVAYMEGAATQWSLDPSLSLVALYRSYLDTLVRDLTGPADARATRPGG